MSINWEKSPEGATHFHYGNVKYSAHWYKDGYFCVVGFEDKGWKQDFDPSPKDQYIERPKHKQWSGPQDGLPPVNTECEVETDYGVWEHGVILCHGYDDFKPHAVAQCASGLWMEEVNGFRPIKTTEQLAAEQREASIREFMDIVGIDCRVTASKAVDAGFKREVA